MSPRIPSIHLTDTRVSIHRFGFRFEFRPHDLMNKIEYDSGTKERVGILGVTRRNPEVDPTANQT